MKLQEILNHFSSVDKRRHLDAKTDFKSSLFKIGKDGYELHVSLYFEEKDIEKAIEMVLVKLKKFQIAQVNCGTRGDFTATKEGLFLASKKFIFSTWHLSIFVKVPFSI